MLSSSNRLSTSLFKEIIQKGSIFHGDFFIVRYMNIAGISRFGISVPKKVAKTAVLRNKIRRRVYSIIENMKDRINKNIKVVMIVKNGGEKASFQALQNDIEKNFVKYGILK